MNEIAHFVIYSEIDGTPVYMLLQQGAVAQQIEDDE
jgi:hypothetical protein